MLKYQIKLKIHNTNLEIYSYEKPITKIRYISTNTNIQKEEKKQKDLQIRSNQSIHRTKTQVKDILSNNKFNKFLTLTFDTQIEDFKQANYEFNKFIKRLKYYFKQDFFYIAIPEKTKKGRIHYHLCLNIPFIPQNHLTKIWQNGFIWITVLKQTPKIQYYLSKYITKEHLPPRIKSFFTSQFLSQPIIKYGADAIMYLFKYKDLFYKYFDKTFDTFYHGLCTYQILNYKYKTYN